MEDMIFLDTAFPDVQIVFDGDKYAGMLTPEGIEASAVSAAFVSNRRVLSGYDEACRSIRRTLSSQLGLEMPKGFVVELTPEDLAVFCTQSCPADKMEAYLEKKREQTRRDMVIWLRERPWDTNPMTAAQARSHNYVFDAGTGEISTDGHFNPARSICLPSSIDTRRVTAIKTTGFVSYTYLEEVVMPDSVTSIEPYAFYDRVHLKRANLSANLEIIPAGLFSRCRSLCSIVIPPGVKEIREEAFYQCPALDTVIIPDTVQSVGRCAFLNVPHIYYHGPAPGFPWGATVGN